MKAYIIGAIVAVSTLAAFTIFGLWIFNTANQNAKNTLSQIRNISFPTPVVSSVPTSPMETSVQTNQIDTTVKKVGKYTYEGALPCDTQMATSNDVYQALNNYREIHGVGSLSWDQRLTEVASLRSSQVLANGGNSDSHQGFIDFTNNPDNFKKAGYQILDENVANTQCPMLGVHIIEWLFARDAPHNNAQLNPKFTAVGISVNNTIVDVIFGAQPF